MRVLEEKHREEVVALRKKLQWFAENQELLDRDAGRLTAATSEIHQLQEQVSAPRLHPSLARRLRLSIAVRMGENTLMVEGVGHHAMCQ